MKTKLITLIFLITFFNLSFSQQTEEEVIEIQEVDTSEDDTSEDEKIEDVPFAIVEIVPVFPGCVGTNKEKKNCLNKKVQEHVMKNFNTSIVDSLDLSPGKKRIYVQFKITKKGEVEVIGVRAPHKNKTLEKEAVRIVELLPKMEPGRQRNKPVNVPYMLPIIFNVEAAKAEEVKN